MAQRHITRFIPDPTTLAAYGGLLAGFLAGAGFGVAAALQFAESAMVAPYGAPALCDLEPPTDGIGFRILLDEATRRPAVNI